MFNSWHYNINPFYDGINISDSKWTNSFANSSLMINNMIHTFYQN